MANGEPATLDSHRAEWLYHHFQAISRAADRYLAVYAFVSGFTVLMVLAPKETFEVPVFELDVAADILLASLCGCGAVLVAAFAGNYDKGEATLSALAISLGCDYSDLWFVDTHPTIIDFLQHVKTAGTRNRIERFISAMLYPALLGPALAWMTVLPAVRLATGRLPWLDATFYVFALLACFFAWRRARVFIGRRWRTYRAVEGSRGQRPNPDIKADSAADTPPTP